MKTRVVARWNRNIGRDEFHVEEWRPEYQQFNPYSGRLSDETEEAWRKRWTYPVPADWEFRIMLADRDEAVEIAQRIAAGGKADRIIIEVDFP